MADPQEAIMINLKPGQAPEISAPISVLEAEQLAKLATNATRLALDTSTHLLAVTQVLLKALEELKKSAPKH
jgi:hypothetical protein